MEGVLLHDLVVEETPEGYIPLYTRTYSPGDKLVSTFCTTTIIRADEKGIVVRQSSDAAPLMFRGTPKTVSFDYFEGLIHGGAQLVRANGEAVL